jgi:hypothetical protein
MIFRVGKEVIVYQLQFNLYPPKKSQIHTYTPFRYACDELHNNLQFCNCWASSSSSMLDLVGPNTYVWISGFTLSWSTSKKLGVQNTPLWTLVCGLKIGPQARSLDSRFEWSIFLNHDRQSFDRTVSPRYHLHIFKVWAHNVNSFASNILLSTNMFAWFQSFKDVTHHLFENPPVG